MGNTTQKFVGVLFFADRIGLGVVDQSDHLHVLCLNLSILATPGRRH